MVGPISRAAGVRHGEFVHTESSNVHSAAASFSVCSYTFLEFEVA